MARRGREYEDAWGGFDSGTTMYNPKEERAYESRIWKYMAAVAAVVLMLVIYVHYTELQLIKNGNCIVADYTVEESGRAVAFYSDESGRYYKFTIGSNAEHEDTEIKLYYTENIKEAEPKTSRWVWVGYYAFFGIMLGVSLWRIRRVYKTIS